MSEKELNEQYIRSNIQGICQDCIYLDKIVPIIREMLSKAYIDGLEQSRFDKRMLEFENEKLKQEINKISKKELKVRDMLYSIEYGTLTRERLNQIEEVLFELGGDVDE